MGANAEVSGQDVTSRFAAANCLNSFFWGLCNAQKKQMGISWLPCVRIYLKVNYKAGAHDDGILAGWRVDECVPSGGADGKD